jgi:hypothetical protein
MRRIAGLAILLLAAAMPVRAQDAGAANCTPVPDLMFGGVAPSRALVAAPPAQGGNDWVGDWRCGAEQGIKIRAAPNGRLGLDGNATYGALDPERVKRGAVNMGEFSTLVPLAADHVAFLLDDDGNPLPCDAARARDQALCGLRLWRLGPYLVVADNLQCGGNDVSFTGVYRRAGNPS